MKKNDKLDFENIIKNIDNIKSEYKRILESFSYYEQKKKILFMRKLKKHIYSLGCDEWKSDRIWDYLNDYEDVQIFW